MTRRGKTADVLRRRATKRKDQMRKDPRTLLDELERLMYGTGPEAEANREFERKWGPILRSDPNSPMGSLLREMDDLRAKLLKQK